MHIADNMSLTATLDDDFSCSNNKHLTGRHKPGGRAGTAYLSISICTSGQALLFTAAKEGRWFGDTLFKACISNSL